MTILNDTVLESNKYLKLNFDGGDLSSDAGLLLIKEFVSKLGIDKLFVKSFKTNGCQKQTGSNSYDRRYDTKS